MGNNDGIIEAICSQGANQIVKFEGGQFSFAFGNEIALVLNHCFYILNCDSKLFEEVKKAVKSGMSKDELKRFWLKKSKKYEISEWSEDFDDLK